MRELKFRAWCANKKEWEKDAWHLTPDGRIVDTYRQIEMRKETHFLNQFTGLLDKQGVEIYEGDIIKCFGDIAKVVWDEHDALYRYIYNSGGERYMKILGTHSYEHFEVIGNIYENPELLHVK